MNIVRPHAVQPVTAVTPATLAQALLAAAGGLDAIKATDKVRAELARFLLPNSGSLAAPDVLRSITQVSRRERARRARGEHRAADRAAALAARLAVQAAGNELREARS